MTFTFNFKGLPMPAHPSACSELLRAAAYAAEKHKLGAPRKGKDAAPYVNHPIAVANLLASEARIDDIAVLQAALLHDVVEDTRTPIEEIEALFGAAVAGIVQEVTDDKSLPGAERKRLQIVNAPGKSQGAAWLKAADKTCNLREIVASAPPWELERKLAYFEHAAQVVRNLPHLPPRLRELFEEAYALRAQLDVSFTTGENL
jgi:GTP diphosphokinase / guanosine-3',5'-bis(diphosphate) 3'-diphosphatase